MVIVKTDLDLEIEQELREMMKTGEMKPKMTIKSLKCFHLFQHLSLSF